MIQGEGEGAFSVTVTDVSHSTEAVGDGGYPIFPSRPGAELRSTSRDSHSKALADDVNASKPPQSSKASRVLEQG